MYAPTRLLIALLLAGIGLLLVGCGSSTPNQRLIRALEQNPFLPRNFTLGVTVVGEGDPSDPAFRPARYIVEADGLLRAAVGPGASPSTFPPVTRRLDDSQLTTLWAMVETAGILKDPDPARIGNPELVEPRRGQTVIVVAARADRLSRASAFELVPADEEVGRVLPLVRQLAEYAWVDRIAATR
jgi:hypothetical protein